MGKDLTDIKGFTLTEVLVVVGIMGLVIFFGARYYYTNVGMYRFQNVLTEFKAAVNLSRVRSVSGRVVSSEGVVGVSPGAISVTNVAYSGNTMTLTTASSSNLTTGSYGTLGGIRPTNLANFSNQNSYTINGRLYKVTGVGDTSLTLQFLDQHPANCMNVDTTWSLSLPSTPVNATAYVFINYAVQITPVASIPGGGYSVAYETGPLMTFQYNQNMVSATVESPPGTQKSQPWIILFQKGLTVGSQTYKVTLTQLATGTKVSYTILPAGAVH